MGTSSFRTLRRKPLAACVASIFALAAPLSCLAVSVSDCGDAGTNTLRGLVAANNVTIDTSACSAITLTSGAIPASQTNLTITGPTVRTTITTTTKDRIFTHTGTGNFTLNYLNVTHGHAYASTSGTVVTGGCISSAGNVILEHSSVDSCIAESKQGRVYGGGIYALKGIAAKYDSTITNNKTTSVSQFTAGGGAYAKGQFRAKYYSTVSGNVACDNPGCSGTGGGVSSAGGAIIDHSTISGNAARGSVGGVSLTSFSASPPAATIRNSTISGNRAVTGSVGGVYSTVPITVSNSTIAFNIASNGSRASGLSIRAQYASITATLNSVLMSNNAYGASPTESDFSASHAAAYTLGVSGANNLIVASSGPVPPNGLITSCAMLGPLRYNGGSTKTHQLLSHSPAFDVGNDTSTATGPHYDQRGTGFPRSLGTNPDIGAFEADQNEVVFNSGFEGCP